MTRRRRGGSGNNSINDSINRLNDTINDLIDAINDSNINNGNNRNNNGNNNGNNANNNRNRRGYGRNYYGNRGWRNYYTDPNPAHYANTQELNEERRRRRREARRRYSEDIIDNSGLGNTVFGRLAHQRFSNQRRADNMRMTANMLNNGGARTVGSALFGTGRAGRVAATALGGFGKILGGVSKILGGPVMWAIQIFIEGLKLAAKAINEWNEVTAKTYENQTAQEKLQYELSKQLFISFTQARIEGISAMAEIQLKMLDTQSATMLEALKITTEQYLKGVQTAIGPITKGINETAYDAAMSRVDAAASIEKLNLHKSQREKEYGRYESLRNLQKEGKLAGLEAERGIAQTQYTIDSQKQQFNFERDLALKHYIASNLMDITGNGTDDRKLQSDINGNVSHGNRTGNGNAMTGKTFRNVNTLADTGLSKDIHSGNKLTEALKKGSGTLETYLKIEEAKMNNTHEMMRQHADANKTQIDAMYEQATTATNYAFQTADKQLDIEVQKKEIVIDTAAQVEKEWLQLTQSIEKYLENFDKVTNDLGINLGYTNSGQLRVFQKSMFNVVENVSSKFGKDIDEIVKLQQSFIETTGRNRIMGEHDYGNLIGLGKYLGDDGLATNYASEMEIFNAGVSDSVDMLDEVLQDVNRIGLNGRKYTKTLVDNLKLAQKYNFKDGTKGLMQMSKWAENTRFNMNSLSGMLDKVSEGGLEGIITQGAQFQVLGGHSAMNADPIAMMYERYADPEAFAKRMQDMTIGYGSLDRVTGETTFSGPEQMLMEQIAKVQGRSYEDVANEVRARNKKEIVSKQLGTGFNDEQQSFISNNATYNRETGQFEVKVLGADGKYTNKGVSQLTEKEIEDLIPKGHDEKMETYMAKVVSAVESMKGEEVRERANAAAAAYEVMLENFKKRTEIAYNSYNEHREEYIEKVKEGMDKITKSFSNYMEIYNKGNADVNEELAKIKTTASDINSALIETANVIRVANAKIASAESSPKNIIRQQGQTSDTRQQTQVNSSSTSNNRVRSGDVINMNDPIARRIIEGDNGHYTHSNRDGTWNRAGAKIYNRAIGLGDGILNNNNQPIIAQASKVTKVQDGASQFVKSDRKDSAIFAKQDGPFDKLFNGIFGKVNEISNYIGRGKDKYYSVLGFNMGNKVRKDWADKELQIRSEIANRRNLHQLGISNKLYNKIFGSGLDKIPKMKSEKEDSIRTEILLRKLQRKKQLPSSKSDPISLLYDSYDGPKNSFNYIANKVREINRAEVMNKYRDNSNGISAIETLRKQNDNLPSSNPKANNSSFVGNNGNMVNFETLKVQINGRIELSSPNGQNIDIIDELRNDPIALRALSRLITKHMSSAFNGGRGTLDIGISNI